MSLQSRQLLQRCCYITKSITGHTNASGFRTSAFTFLRERWNAPVKRVLKNRVDKLKRLGEYPTVSRRSEFIEWNFEAEIYAFGKRLNEKFNDTLLIQALTEESYLFQKEEENRKSDVPCPDNTSKNNEALALSGGALIISFCKKYLRSVYTKLPEEGIEHLVDYLSSTEVLSKIGKGLGLRDLIFSKEYPPSDETFARCTCAVIGAHEATNSGSDKNQKFILDFVVTQLMGQNLWDIWIIQDPYSVLQVIHERIGKSPPEPRIIGELGRNTVEAVYNIGLYCDKEFIGAGFGETPQVGLTVAAYDCLGRYFGHTLSADPLPINEGLQATILKDTPNPTLRNWTPISANV